MAAPVTTDSDTVESDDPLVGKIKSEDLLIEIFVLLPRESIFTCVCVSRKWRNILTDPLFLRSYNAAARRRIGGGRLLAFFQRTTNNKPMEPGKHCNTLRIPIPGRRLIDPIPAKFGYFINSCNGLILCSHGDRRGIYHVVNPVTRKYVSLPPPHNWHIPLSVGILCEENTTDLVPIYTIIRAGLPLSSDNPKILHIDTYSSRTGEWSDPRPLAATDRFFLVKRAPVVANGIFHWHSTSCSVAVYDPSGGENHVQLIRLPYFGSTDSYAITRSADDLLWFGITYFEENRRANNRQTMKFFVLPKGEDGSYRRETSIDRDEWVLTHDISLDSLCQDIQILDAEEKISLESIISTWDSQLVAVLRQWGRVFLYNLETESIERIQYVGRHSGCDGNYLCPYIESSFLSSYAL